MSPSTPFEHVHVRAATAGLRIVAQRLHGSARIHGNVAEALSGGEWRGERLADRHPASGKRLTRWSAASHREHDRTFQPRRPLSSPTGCHGTDAFRDGWGTGQPSMIQSTSTTSTL